MGKPKAKAKAKKGGKEGKDALPAPAKGGEDSEQGEEADDGQPHHKKAVALSRKTGKAHRKEWSCSYDAGFEAAHRDAVTRIQKSYRRYRAWKQAKRAKAEILRQREKLGGKDHLGRLLLFLFNLVGMLLGIFGAIGVWYFLLNCPPSKGGFDIGPQLCMDSMANGVLFNIQLVFAALCFIGLRSVRKDRLAWLRGYSFFVLLLVGAQLSVVGMFLLDRSAAVAGMKQDTYVSLRNQVCTLDTVLGTAGAASDMIGLSDLASGVADGVADGVGGLVSDDNVSTAVAINNSTNTTDGFREWLGVDALCSCTKPGNECVADWLAPRLNRMIAVFFSFILLQIMMAHFAWRFLGLPSEAGASEGDIEQVKMWLSANDLHLYEKQFLMKGVRTKDALLDLKLDTVKQIGMSLTDTRTFMLKQNESKVKELDMQDHLGLTGWDKMITSAMGTDPTDDMNMNAKIMTKTLYFELTVLASVGLCMWVLAKDSRTFPPSDDEAIVMASAQMFITIFLTLEMMLELVLSATSRRALQEYFSDGWHLLDIFVLMVFWLHQFYPSFRGWIVPLIPALGSLPEITPGGLSVLRALRVLRPLRTLRLLGDISLVAQCISSSAGLFRDAMVFVVFLITLFAMIGTSSFSGALHYTCARCDTKDVATVEAMQVCAMDDRKVYLGNTLLTGAAGWVRADKEDIEAHWTTNTTKLEVCPQSLNCATAAKEAGTFIRCIERDVLEVGEDGYGTRSFDNFFSAFYTMFILLSGDNGMQDIPNAMFAVDASSEWLAWPVCFVASFGLTLVALNLVLAICCSVFEDIHGALEGAKEKRLAARELKNKIEKLDEIYNQQERDRKDEEHAKNNIVLKADDVLENAIEGGAKAVMGVADGMRSRLLDNPETALGLQDMEANRKEMDREIRENAAKSGKVAQYVVMVGRSWVFEILVMLMIVAYTLSVLNQETANGINQTWVDVELGVMMFFVLEAIMMCSGLGWRHYFTYGENRLDFIILMCTIAGHVATHQMAALEAAEAQANAGFSAATFDALSTDDGANDTSSVFEKVSLSQVNTESETALRIIKMMRIFQMFRMTYKYQTMREILETVFKTASTIVYLICFVIFVLCMCSLIMMHLVSGGCDETYNPQVSELWGDETCSYPDSNFESFNVGFFTMYQIMIGEDWSEIMFWYYTYSPLGRLAAPLFMSVWFVVHGVLFSLFVAVLLLNFGMDEDEKMPLQKQQYDAYVSKKKHDQHSSLVDTHAIDAYERAEGKAIDTSETELVILLEEAAGKVGAGERKMEHRSLFIFFLNHPVRMFCARVEQHVYFEVMMILLICLSCISVAAEGPGCGEADEMFTMLQDGSMTGSKDCPENPLESFFAAVGYLVLGALLLELVLRSISGGFLLTSGPSRSYLQNKQNFVDFVIIVVILATHSADLWMSNAAEHQVTISLVRAMAPMFSLVRNRPLRKIFRAFGNALPLIATVSVPIVFLMMMMSVVGVDLFGHGRMQQCMATGNRISYLNGESYAGYNQTQCLVAAADGLDVDWINPPFNFDTGFDGLLTLFKAATAGVMPMWNVAKVSAGTGLAPTEGAWVKEFKDDGSMYSAHDSDPPRLWNTVYFFSMFHVIFTFFLMNLFIGVMSVSFSKSTGTIMITTLQRRWIQCQTMVDKFRPMDDLNEEYRPMPGQVLFHVRLGFFTVVTNDYFHNFVTGLIMANCIILLLEHYPADDEYSQLIGYIDILFLLFYCAEMFAKMIGLGFRNYFRSGWNSFDFVLISTSLCTAVVGTVSGIEGLRALRSFRLFLLVQHLPGLMSLIDTVIHCLPPSLTIGAIMAVFFYLYCMIGMRVFGSTVIEHEGGYYDANNNFDSFWNAFKLLAQVLLGQNYMWLTADLVSEGHDEGNVFLYFGSFFLINVLININLFAVVVLDNFGAQNPVAQTIQPVDLWSYTYCWAELTIGAAACPSLHKGKAASMMDKFEKKEADKEENDDKDSEFELCEHTGNVLNSSDGSTATGHKALIFKSKMERKVPKGVVQVNVRDFRGLRIRDQGDAFEGARPFVQLFSKPNGRSHPEHTAVQTKVYNHGDNQKVEFGDDNGEKFEIYLNERAKNITFEIIDSRDNSKIAQATITAQEIVKYTNAVDPEDLYVDLTGGKKRLDEGTPEELEKYYEQIAQKSPRAGSKSPRSAEPEPEPLTAKEQKAVDKAAAKAEKAAAKAAKKAEKEAAKAAKKAAKNGKETKPPRKKREPEIPMFYPIVGKLHVELVFRKGEALPTFGFMGDFNDNQELKEHGCGLEGWVWKKSDDLHSKWERRWMWMSTVKTLPTKDPYPEIYYNRPKNQKVLRVKKLEEHIASTEGKLAQLNGLRKKDKKAKTAIGDAEHKLVTLAAALEKAIKEAAEAKPPVGYYSHTPGNKALEDIMPVDGWREPTTSIELGPEEQNEVGIYYYKEVDDEGEMENTARRGKLKSNFVPASQIINVLDHIEGSNTATATHFGHSDHDATRLFDSEFQFTRREHINDEGEKRKESVYKCRAMSPQQKVGWVASLKWLAGGRMETDASGKDVYVMDAERPGRLAHPPLNDRDLVRVKNNPGLIPLPFSHLRHLLTHTIYRGSSLGNHRLTREWLMYITFNLEMKCMQDLDERKGDTRRAHIGEYINELRGLDYHKTLRQLCLLHYEKRHSLMYPQQIEEYNHDLRKVALNMITCAIAGWIHGKALPKFHEQKYGAKMKTGRKVESAEDRKERKKNKKKGKKRKPKPAEITDEPEDNGEAAERCNTYPRHPLWRKRPAAHAVAAVGVSACRLESLKFLFRAVKKEKPALLTQQEVEDRLEQERVAALTEDELAAEERAKAEDAKFEEDKAAAQLLKLEQRATGCCRRGGDEVDDSEQENTKAAYSNPMMLADVDDDDAPDGDVTVPNPMFDSDGGSVVVAAAAAEGSDKSKQSTKDDPASDTAFEPKRYRTLNYGIFREGCDKHTEDIGHFQAGEEVLVLEERGKRVRTEKGWISKISESGKVLLQELDHTGDESTMSMFDDADETIIEANVANDSRPTSPVVFDNPMESDGESGDESEQDSDDEVRDEEGKTKRERREDREYEKIFAKHGGSKGFLVKDEAIALLTEHYESTMAAEDTTAKKYVKKHFEEMCKLSPAEGDGEMFDMDAWRNWDASEDVVGLRLGRKKAKKELTKEQLYHKQHQASLEEADRLKQEVFADPS
jgi:hypothetical protein